MTSLWCCHTEDVYGEILPHKHQCVCLCHVWVCLCVERGTMLWSSDCKPAVWRMINQTDWMGQIWFVIAQKRSGSERGDRLLCCTWRCVRGGVDVCSCVLILCAKVQRCVWRGGHWSEAAVCLRVRGQINGTWKTKNTVRRCWHSHSPVNISQRQHTLCEYTVFFSHTLTYKHMYPSVVQSNVWVIELCHCSFVIADVSLHSLCAWTIECRD